MKKFWGKIKGFFKAFPAKVGEFFSNKKAFYILIGASAALLVAAVVVLGVIRPFRTVVLGVNVNQSFDQNQLIPFKDGGLFGYMDTRGRIVISPRFDKARSFNGRFAIVTSGDRDQIINRKGDVQIDALRETIFYDEVSGTWLAGGTLYNKNLKRVSKNKYDVRRSSRGLYPYVAGEEHGIMNSRGKVLYECGNLPCTVETSVTIKELRDTYALVTIQGGNRVIINANSGRVILEYGETTDVEVKDNNIFAVTSVENGRQVAFYRYIERNRIAIETEEGVTFSLFDAKNQFFLTDFGETWADRGRSSRYAFFRQKDDSFFATTARRALTVDELTTGLSRSSCGNNKHGINSGENEVLKCEYDDVELLDASLFVFLRRRVGQEIVILKNDGKYTLYDMRKGKILMSTEMPIQFASNSPFFASYDSRSEKVMVYNAITGATEQLPTAGATSWTQGANFFSVNSTGRIRYYNNRLEEIRSTSPN